MTPTFCVPKHYLYVAMMKLAVFLTVVMCIVRRGDAFSSGASAQGGMNYGVAGGVFGPAYQ